MDDDPEIHTEHTLELCEQDVEFLTLIWWYVQ
jgi:hypothetical protein